jgi:hypothetical protein
VIDLSEWPQLKKVYDSFAERGILSQEMFDALTEEMQSGAFVTLGASDEVIAQKLTDLITRAIGEGMTDKAFVEAVDSTLSNPSYWSLVFHMNVMNAFNSGNYAALFHGPNADDYPAWQFVGPEPIEENCPDNICGEMYRLAFDKSDPEAQIRMPLVHFGCHHSIRWLTQEEADEIGITDAAEMPEPAEGFDYDKVAAIPQSLRRAA